MEPAGPRHLFPQENIVTQVRLCSSYPVCSPAVPCRPTPAWLALLLQGKEGHGDIAKHGRSWLGRRWPCCGCWPSCALGLVGRYWAGSTQSTSCRILWTRTSACDVRVADPLLHSGSCLWRSCVSLLCTASGYPWKTQWRGSAGGSQHLLPMCQPL